MLELMPPFYFLTFATVSVSVSKTFGLKKSLGIGLENIWSRKKVSVTVSKKVSVSVSNEISGLVTQWGQGYLEMMDKDMVGQGR